MKLLLTVAAAALIATACNTHPALVSTWLPESNCVVSQDHTTLSNGVEIEQDGTRANARMDWSIPEYVEDCVSAVVCLESYDTAAVGNEYSIACSPLLTPTANPGGYTISRQSLGGGNTITAVESMLAVVFDTPNGPVGTGFCQFHDADDSNGPSCWPSVPVE